MNQVFNFPSMGVFIGSLFCLIVLALGALTFIDFRKQSLTRLGWLKQVFEESRLRRMLLLRRRDPAQYLKTVSTSDLDQQLINCRECPDKKACDAAQRQGSSADFSYCPNSASIERLTKVNSGL